MRKLLAVLVLAVVAVATAGTVGAQVPVNIVYPINGATYPITDPATGPLFSHYFTSSFSVTCEGDHTVEWGYDSNPAIGSAAFYDQFSAQFVYKLPGGTHTFWVRSNCGSDAVRFKIGS